MPIRFLQNIFYIFDGFFKWFLLLFRPMSITAKKRYLICKKCPHKKRRHCDICGCFIKAKVLVDYPISDIDGLSIGGCSDEPPRW